MTTTRSGGGGSDGGGKGRGGFKTRLAIPMWRQKQQHQRISSEVSRID